MAQVRINLEKGLCTVIVLWQEWFAVCEWGAGGGGGGGGKRRSEGRGGRGEGRGRGGGGEG